MAIDIGQRIGWAMGSPLGRRDYETTDLETAQQLEIRIQKLKEENQKLIERLRESEKLITDSYGVLVEKFFNAEAPKLIEYALKNNLEIGVIFTDIDGMKKLNDLKGHAEGDRILKTTSNVLNRSLRKTDIVTRKGDEFIILAFVDKEGLETVGKKIQEKINEEYNREGFGDNSISFGVARIGEHISGDRVEHCPENEIFEKGHKFLLSEAIEVADQRMYKDKESRGAER